MKSSLSILLPIYNDVCAELVSRLVKQAERLAHEGLNYEIIVADDGSTDGSSKEANRKINAWAHCRYIERGTNVGRAAIRNFLASQARCEWLLFIDSDMQVCEDDYLHKYVERPDTELVVDGGVGTPEALRKKMTWNLRCRYECGSEDAFTAEQRQKNPYSDFHTANFLVRRDVMLSHPFDERFRRYGYEDVLFGKQLRRDRIAITHIANPVWFDSFESNKSFVSKTEEGLRTLYEFRDELRGYSRLLTFVEGIHIGAVRTGIRIWHRVFGRLERTILCGNRPSLKVFKLYKLGYYLSLNDYD